MLNIFEVCTTPNPCETIIVLRKKKPIANSTAVVVEQELRISKFFNTISIFKT